MSAFVLCPYQQDMVTNVGQAFRNGGRRVLAVLPTGGGKTVAFFIIEGDWC